MKLTLPYPPSANRYWRLTHGHISKSNEARQYQSDVKKIALAAGAAKPLLCDVVVEVNVYRPRRIGDLDNSLKIIFDAVRGVLYEDDKQIVEIRAKRFDDAERPRLELRVLGTFEGLA